MTVRVEAQPPISKEAHDELLRTITTLDAEVFDAYNRCDLTSSPRISRKTWSSITTRKNYGAVELGAHRFCDPKKYEKCGERDSGVAKFVMLWQRQDGGVWKITRVISFDHVSSAK